MARLRPLRVRRRGELDDASREELLVEDGEGSFGPAERPMAGYAAIPPAWRASPERARPWVERALAHIGALPPKARKPRAKKPVRPPVSGAPRGRR
ncbi:hypothetical protein GCM10009609_14330 [Pseudonocardia aurantiaca]